MELPHFLEKLFGNLWRKKTASKYLEILKYCNSLF